MGESATRSLGFWACLALMVGNFIGVGVFALPTQMAPLGWNSVLGWLITIAGALCLAVVFSRLAKAMPQAIGPYVYVERAFGPLAAFVVAWAYWVSIWVGNTAIATASISYLSHFFPALAANPWFSASATIALLWAVTAINATSTRAAGGVQLITTALKLVPLLVAIVVAALVLGESRQVASPPLRAADLDFGSVSAAATLALFAMLGIESASVAARRVSDPERNVPRATLIGTALVGLIYLLTSAPVTLMLPADQVAASNAPFALFVATYWNDGLASLVALFAFISGMGCLNGWVLLQSEVPLAMARGGTFPRWFERVSARSIPIRGLLVSSGLSTLLVLANSSRTLSGLFAFMALLTTISTLALYVSCALAALRLQAGGVVAGSAALSGLALLGLLYGLWAMYGAGSEAAAWGAALLAAGVPIYFLMRWSRSSPLPEENPALLRE
ncbi:MAG: amino acid permease [Sphingosinicella sp.]